MRHYFFVIALLLVHAFVWPGPRAAAQEAPAAVTLESRIKPLAAKHKGKVAIAIKHLETGEMYLLSPDEAMATASLIKFPIMLEAYLQAAEGKLKLTDMVTLREADKVPGSGILTYHFSEGATFSLRDAIRLMMVYSDNTATNLVLDKIGIPSTNKRMAEWGMPNTRINAKVYLGSKTSIDPARTKEFGLGSTTARDMINLLEKVHKGEVVSAKICDEMLGHMKKCEDGTKLKRFLPPKTPVAHKIGAVSNVRTDAGIIYSPSGPFAIAVLTWNNEDKSVREDNAAHVFIGRVAREAYDHFVAKKK